MTRPLAANPLASVTVCVGLLAAVTPCAGQEAAEPKRPAGPDYSLWVDRGLAIGDVPAAPPPEPKITFSATGGYQYVSRAPLSTLGNLDIHRVNLEIGAQFDLARDVSVIANFGFEANRYQFSPVTDLGADPWDDAFYFGLDVRLQWAWTNQALVWAGGIFQSWREDGSDFNRSVTGGGVIGASWIWDDNLTFGIGVGAMTQLSRDALVWPVLQLDWKITDGLRLRTVPGPTGVAATGLEIAYAFGDHFDIGVGGRYEYRRFRLDNIGVAPGGVGQEINWPIWVRLGVRFNPNFSIDLFGGAVAGGEVSIENSAGGQLAKTRYAITPTVAVVGRIRF